MYTYLAYAGTAGDYRHYISIAISIAIITPLLLLLLSWCSFNDVTFVMVKTFGLVGLMRMHKTGCSGETRPVLHVPSSS